MYGPIGELYYQAFKGIFLDVEGKHAKGSCWWNQNRYLLKQMIDAMRQQSQHAIRGIIVGKFNCLISVRGITKTNHIFPHSTTKSLCTDQKHR